MSGLKYKRMSLTVIQNNYVIHIEGLSNASAAAASVKRILTGNPQPGIETQVNTEWGNSPNKKAYEDIVVGAIIDGTVIPESEHSTYENEFNVQDVQFEDSEHLSDLCKRKKRPA